MKRGIKIYRTNKITKDDIGHKVEVTKPACICRVSPSLASLLKATLYKMEGDSAHIILSTGTVGKLKNFENGYALVQVGQQEFVYQERGIEVIGKGRMRDLW